MSTAVMEICDAYKVPFSGKLVEVGRCFYQSSLVDVHHGQWQQNDGERQKVALKTVRCVGGRLRHSQMRSRRDDVMLVNHLTRFVKEYPNWMGLQHKNVVPVLDIKIDFEPVIVNPFHGINLKKYLSQNPETNRYLIASQVACGLAYLHSRKTPVVHGGLSFGSVLMNDSGEAMVSNFGLEPICAEIADDIKLTVNALITSYISAPEMLFGDENGDIKFTPESDVWDFGSFLLELFSGHMPFYGVGKGRGILSMSKGWKPTVQDFPEIPEKSTLWSIIRLCFETNPADRPNMETIYNWLNDKAYNDDSVLFETLYEMAKL